MGRKAESVDGIRPHIGRWEDDRLREAFAKVPQTYAFCHVTDPHSPHNWADRSLSLIACPGREAAV